MKAKFLIPEPKQQQQCKIIIFSSYVLIVGDFSSFVIKHFVYGFNPNLNKLFNDL